MMAKTDEQAIEYHYNRASMLADELIEKEARRIMRKHKSLIEFTQGMGAWFFTDKNGNHIIDGSKVEPVAKLFDTWDWCFKMTGQPRRFTADGEVVYDW
jgi:hypothetical protein